MELTRLQRNLFRRAWAAVACTASIAVAMHAMAQDIVPYQVALEGPADPELLESLRNLSESMRLREERPVASVVHLERRAARDKDTFMAYLHSRGFYGAAVDVTIDADARPVMLAFSIQAGPQYVLTEVNIRHVAPGTPAIVPLPTPESLDLHKGRAFRAQAVLDAEERLITRLGEQGHAFAAVPDRDVIVDHEARSVSVTFNVDPGPKAVFGALAIEGLDNVRERAVQDYVVWEPGAVYDARLVTRTQNALYRSGLFSTVRVAVATTEPQMTVPMVIEVAERKHRTIAAGLQYRTDEGGSLRLRWEHRNMHGLGRRLGVDVHVGQIQTSIETKYTLPRWRRDNQTLELSAHVGEWSPDAYTSRRIGVGAWVERHLSERWSGGTGIGFRWDDIEQDGKSEQYHLISNPWRFTFDNVNDPLDPQWGRRIVLNAEPFAGVGSRTLLFAKSDVEYTEYFRLDDEGDWIVATRARLGLSMGAGLRDMPPDERYYASGAASIRGYAYQSVGPLADDDDPIGGRSVFDMSVELRRKITRDIGIVTFIDGGSAFEESLPTFSDLRWGAGMGLRYYTPIGPIGLDLAVPLNKRGFDDSFHVYITLGQAF